MLATWRVSKKSLQSEGKIEINTDMIEQKIYTATSSLVNPNPPQIVEKITKDGWEIKQVSTATYNVFDEQNKPTPYLAITILLEREV